MITTFRPRGVCSQFIEIETEGEIIRSVRFLGGCPGNTQGISALIRGMTVSEAISRLKGIQCGRRGTSCPDQLSIALEQIRQ